MAKKLHPYVTELRDARKAAVRHLVKLDYSESMKISGLISYIRMLEEYLEANLNFAEKKKFSWWVSDRMHAYFPSDSTEVAGSEYWQHVLKTKP
jgi:hypothetical protein